MASGNGRTMKLPLVPLARDSVLLPGVTLRIPIANRQDIPLLLTNLFSRASSRSSKSSILVGCVPLDSPFLSKDGQKLLGGAEQDARHSVDQAETDPGNASKSDLFSYGTIARVIGVQGRAKVEPYLVVEGAKRFSIRKIVKEKPYFEAEVAPHDEPGMGPVQSSFLLITSLKNS
jgi:ATP-dependent Lon protease